MLKKTIWRNVLQYWREASIQCLQESNLNFPTVERTFRRRAIPQGSQRNVFRMNHGAVRRSPKKTVMGRSYAATLIWSFRRVPAEEVILSVCRSNLGPKVHLGPIRMGCAIAASLYTKYNVEPNSSSWLVWVLPMVVKIRAAVNCAYNCPWNQIGF